jgi:signal peptidase I
LKNNGDIFVKSPPASDNGGDTPDDADRSDVSSETIQVVTTDDLPSGNTPLYAEDDFTLPRIEYILQNLTDWLGVVLVPFICVTLAFVFLFRETVVSGDSMLPTLEDKQMLAISDLFYDPAYNDIVVVWAEDVMNSRTGTRGEPIIKRVVGVAGDRIRIDFKEEVVYRNGVALKKEFLDGSWYEDGHLVRDFHYGIADNQIYGTLFEGGEEIIPEGCIFVLGDNRGVSKDSRSVEVGMVDMRMVVGKALFRIRPFDKMGIL